VGVAVWDGMFVAVAVRVGGWVEVASTVGVVVGLGIIVVRGREICFSRPNVGSEMSEGVVEQATSRMAIRIRRYAFFIDE